MRSAGEAKTMTFDELIGAMKTRLGQRMRVSRIRPNSDGNGSDVVGVLRPGSGFQEEAEGLDLPSEATPDETGAWTFRVAPHAYWFRLHPVIVRQVHEEAGQRLLRIELMDDSTIVIETLEPAEPIR